MVRIIESYQRADASVLSEVTQLCVCLLGLFGWRGRRVRGRLGSISFPYYYHQRILSVSSPVPSWCQGNLKLVCFVWVVLLYGVVRLLSVSQYLRRSMQSTYLRFGSKGSDTCLPALYLRIYLRQAGSYIAIRLGMVLPGHTRRPAKSQRQRVMYSVAIAPLAYYRAGHPK